MIKFYFKRNFILWQTFSISVQNVLKILLSCIQYCFDHSNLYNNNVTTLKVFKFFGIMSTFEAT